MKACTTGKHFPNADALGASKAGGTQQEYLRHQTHRRSRVVLPNGRRREAGRSADRSRFTLERRGRRRSSTRGSPRRTSRLKASLGAASVAARLHRPDDHEGHAVRGLGRPRPRSDVHGRGFRRLQPLADRLRGRIARRRVPDGLRASSQPAPTHAFAKGGIFEIKAYGFADPWAEAAAGAEGLRPRMLRPRHHERDDRAGDCAALVAEKVTGFDTRPPSAYAPRP